MKIKDLIEQLQKLDGEKTISGINNEVYEGKEYYNTHKLVIIENKHIEDLCIEEGITFDKIQNIKTNYYI